MKYKLIIASGLLLALGALATATSQDDGDTKKIDDVKPIGVVSGDTPDHLWACEPHLIFDSTGETSHGRVHLNLRSATSP